MRVLMISYEYPPEVVGGLGAAVSGLARALARRGDYVQVISASSIGDGSSSQRRRCSSLQGGTVSIPRRIGSLRGRW